MYKFKDNYLDEEFLSILINNKNTFKEISKNIYYGKIFNDLFIELIINSIENFESTLDENSPHYSDQAHLFAKNEMKPIWINLKDIKLNLWKSYSPNGQVVTKE